MLDFRILSGAVVVAVLIMAGIMLSLDPGDVAVATLPRPHVETAIARIEETNLAPQPAKEIVLPQRIQTPAIASKPADEPKEIVLHKPVETPAIAIAPAPKESVAPAPEPAPAIAALSLPNGTAVPRPIPRPAIAVARVARQNDITGSINPADSEAEAAQPRPRQRVAAKKAEPEAELFNPLKLLFPFADFTKSPFPVFVQEKP
jgi:hypothetical protein